MRHSVIIKKLRYRNFLGSGNYWTVLDFEDARTQIVTGMNGSGKSSLIDALSYVLYGKPYRNDVNIPQLTNTITKKGMLIELILEVRSNIYLIRRGLEPRVFEIFDISNDGRLIDQRTGVYEYQDFLENHILKRKHKTFCQTVVLGSSNFIPFMKLVSKGRREVVEDLLDISICSTMNDILKEKTSSIKTELAEISTAVNLLRQKIDLQKKHAEEIKAIKGGALKEKEDKIRGVVKDIESKVGQALVASKKKQQTQEYVDKQKENKEKKAEYEQMAKELFTLKKMLQNDVKFYNKNKACPTCHQDITEEFRYSQIGEKIRKVEELEEASEKVTALIKESDDLYEELKPKLQDYMDACDELQRANTERGFLERTLQSLQGELFVMRKALKDETEEVQEVLMFQDKSKTLDDLLEMEKDAQERLALANLAAIMLKDNGIKARVIRQYVPILNTLINKYLEELDLFVGFTFDENFNERFLSRYRDEFSYGLFSEGEKAKINIAILFAWLEVMCMRNSTSFNLLVLDEVLDGSMDQEGLDAAVRLFLGTSNKTIMVISPKPQNWISKFDKVIKFQKVKNFSHMMEE